MVSRSSILKALIYSDIFDFPLKKEEIRKFLIGKKISKESFEKELKSLVSQATPLGCNRKFYYLLGREKIVERRIERKIESKKKLKLAKKIIKKLSFVPTVLLVGISGGLALENSKEKDDIDLFVITRLNTLWITRLLLVLLLIIMGQYRGRGKKESQKICLNMLIDEDALVFHRDRQNLYTAHEIVQLKPIFDRNDTYRRFIYANKWVSKFLPNAVRRFKKRKNPLFVIHNSLFFFEKLAKFIQLIYMKRHRTREVISDHFLAFHPHEYKNYALKEYNKRLKQHEV